MKFAAMEAQWDTSASPAPWSAIAIIDEEGEAHLRTGFPICYTSVDSVFQIAAHEEVIPLPELYRMCEIARDILVLTAAGSTDVQAHKGSV